MNAQEERNSLKRQLIESITFLVLFIPLTIVYLLLFIQKGMTLEFEHTLWQQIILIDLIILNLTLGFRVIRYLKYPTYKKVLPYALSSIILLYIVALFTL